VGFGKTSLQGEAEGRWDAPERGKQGKLGTVTLKARNGRILLHSSASERYFQIRMDARLAAVAVQMVWAPLAPAVVGPVGSDFALARAGPIVKSRERFRSPIAMLAC